MLVTLSRWPPGAVTPFLSGQLTRDFKHTRLDFSVVEEEGVKKLRLDCHLGKRKSLAVMRTVTSHIQNLFTGVSKVRRGGTVFAVRAARACLCHCGADLCDGSGSNGWPCRWM